ncbi:MAG: helix-turn-helix domain-containing protein [Planctomycetales bacterium]|nr:helix-turn-helix domain-containing protein [Planctomycetales bacterium]
METHQEHSLDERLARIEAALTALVSEQTRKEFYSTSEVAEILGKAEFTVREWCRLGRVHALKRSTGRGRSQEWMISDDELTRIRNEGLLPQPKFHIDF